MTKPHATPAYNPQDVRCPLCTAPAGEPCMGLTRGRVHGERIMLFEETPVPQHDIGDSVSFRTSPERTFTVRTRTPYPDGWYYALNGMRDRTKVYAERLLQRVVTTPASNPQQESARIERVTQEGSVPEAEGHVIDPFAPPKESAAEQVTTLNTSTARMVPCRICGAEQGNRCRFQGAEVEGAVHASRVGDARAYLEREGFLSAEEPEKPTGSSEYYDNTAMLYLRMARNKDRYSRSDRAGFALKAAELLMNAVEHS